MRQPCEEGSNSMLKSCLYFPDEKTHVLRFFVFLSGLSLSFSPIKSLDNQ